MLTNSKAFSGFAVKDLGQAKAFYGDTLGLRVTEERGMLRLHIEGDTEILIYPKADHVPAVFTILNFPVDDLDKAVAGLTERGVRFEHYEGFNQEPSGIARAEGMPGIAWFTDPSGNVLAVIAQ